MPEFQAPMLDMKDWPPDAVDYVRAQEYAHAIDTFVRAKREPPQALLNAWAAKQTAASLTGHIYRAEMYLGRVRLWVERPGKPPVASV